MQRPYDKQKYLGEGFPKKGNCLPNFGDAFPEEGNCFPKLGEGFPEEGNCISKIFYVIVGA
jgi:hypothetical protein